MRMKVIKISAVTLLFICAMLINLMFPSYSLNGAIDGLIICGEVIIPSLFPFCVLALFAQKSGIMKIVSKPFSSIARKLFHQNNEQFGVFLMSFLGGYPVGSRLINELYKEKRIDKKRAGTMLLYCVNSGPAFVLIAVGVGILGRPKSGAYILISNIIASIAIAMFAERHNSIPRGNKITAYCGITDSFVSAVSDSVKSMFTICGWVVLFSALLSFVKCGVFSKYIEKFICAFLEVSNGVISLDGNVPLIAGIIGFGGVCVHCQVYSSAQAFAPKYSVFLAYRVTHAVISSGVTYIMLKLSNETVQTLTNNVDFMTHNRSFTYASALALMFTGVVLIASTYGKEKSVEKPFNL